ncbi:MAG: hypothetical protein AABY15_07310 [Nanoarchaeota archaeon]
MPAIRDYGAYPEKDNNEEIKKQRQKATELYIIDINNKLFELCQFLHLDLSEIKKINPNDYGSEKSWRENFGDKEKKTIISSIIAEEQNKSDKKTFSGATSFKDIAEQLDEIRPYFKQSTIDSFERATYAKEKAYQDSLIAAGITKNQLAWLNNQNIDNDQIRKEALIAVGIREPHLSKLTNEAVAKEVSDKIKSKVLKTGHPKGQPPPKTDWKRIDISKDEKEKIISSLRANPVSKSFSSHFTWTLDDFVRPFKYLEDSKDYSGPFIVSIIKDDEEFKKYSNIQKVSEGISKIYSGKYLLLSIYDITASSKNSNEAKYIYMGLKYNGMEGMLEFDTMGSISGVAIKKSQKALAIEFMDVMKIKYSIHHEDLSE